MTQSDEYDISSYLAKYKSWSKKYQPIFQINCSLDALPEGLDASYVWTELGYEYGSFLHSGFYLDDEQTTNVLSYIVTGKPVLPEDADTTITTFAGFDCLTCDENGQFEGDECPDCEGEFTIFRSLGISYPTVVSNPDEIKAVLKDVTSGQKATSTTILEAQFCSMCGIRRSNNKGRFCSSCGEGL